MDYLMLAGVRGRAQQRIGADHGRQQEAKAMVV
jgi:hypothetical protein